MLKPVNNYVLVEIKPEEEKTQGGLYVPQTVNVDAKEFLKTGVVASVSDKVKDESSIKENDTVYFNRHATTKVPGHENLFLVRVEDLYLVEC